MAIEDLKGQMSRLPEQPGVYLFLGSAGETLYVGKARDTLFRGVLFAPNLG